MSKSLKRVEAALAAQGLSCPIVACSESARTAAEAAAAAGCEIDQIVKSIIFQDRSSGEIVLFLTSGGNRVDPDAAGRLAGGPLGRADADRVRAVTGFAIGGVSPVGHLEALRTFADPRLLAFPTVWAAAGTPQHIFAINPADLVRITAATVAPFTV